jgi:hypothetical protein
MNTGPYFEGLPQAQSMGWEYRFFYRYGNPQGLDVNGRNAEYIVAACAAGNPGHHRGHRQGYYRQRIRFTLGARFHGCACLRPDSVGGAEEIVHEFGRAKKRSRLVNFFRLLSNALKFGV